MLDFNFKKLEKTSKNRKCFCSVETLACSDLKIFGYLVSLARVYEQAASSFEFASGKNFICFNEMFSLNTTKGGFWLLFVRVSIQKNLQRLEIWEMFICIGPYIRYVNTEYIILFMASCLALNITKGWQNFDSFNTVISQAFPTTE